MADTALKWKSKGFTSDVFSCLFRCVDNSDLGAFFSDATTQEFYIQAPRRI